MIEDYFFLKNNVVQIDAAVIGVSKQRWKTIGDRAASLQQAQLLMSKYKFDVLPITSERHRIKEYFCTKTWNNYQEIDRQQIDYEDVICFQTPLRLLIKNFALENRLFYFLVNEHRVVGLVSIVNLNSRQVRIFIFSLISELEIKLSKFIRAHLQETEILPVVKEDTRTRYLTDRSQGLESNLMEYLYLSDLINLIAKNELLYRLLGYSSRRQFEKSFGKINALRNQTAHPSRSIVVNLESVKKLWQKIETIERSLFYLSQAEI